MWKKIHGKDNGKQLSIVFIDLAKAFPSRLFSQEPRSCPDHDAYDWRGGDLYTYSTTQFAVLLID